MSKRHYLEPVIVVALIAWTYGTVSACYKCDQPGQPRCPNVQPDYPKPDPAFGSHLKDAGDDG